MTWTAPGSWLHANTTTLSTNNQAVGNLLLVEVINKSNNTVWCSSLSGGGATWTALGVKFLGVTNADGISLFAGTVTATGAGTVTPTWSGTAPAAYELNGHEFASSVGSWALDVQGNLDSASTANWPSLTPAADGELYFGYARNAAGATVGSTAGYVYQVVPTGNAAAYNLSCPKGIATFPVWTDGTQEIGTMVLVRETWLVLQSASTGLDPGAATATYTSNVSAGTKLIAYICTGGGGNPQVTAVKDAALNAMTKVGSAFLNNTAASGELSIWAMDTPAGDVGTKPVITVTQTGGNQSFGLVIQEVSGLAPGNSIDGIAAASTGSISANGPIAEGAYSTSAVSEFLVAVGGDNEAATLTWAVPTGSTTYTRDANARNASAIFNCVPSYGYSTGGAETASSAITGAGTAAAWATLFVAFRMAGGSAGMAQQRQHAGRRKGRRHGAQRQVQQAAFGIPVPPGVTLLPVIVVSPPVTVQDGATW